MTSEGLRCFLVRARIEFADRPAVPVYYYLWAESEQHASERVAMPVERFKKRGVRMVVESVVLDPEPPEGGPTASELAQLASEKVNSLPWVTMQK
jgi:hypothetical protein